MAHQYSRVGFNSSVEVNEVNLSLYYGGVRSNIDQLTPVLSTKARDWPIVMLEGATTLTNCVRVLHEGVAAVFKARALS